MDDFQARAAKIRAIARAKARRFRRFTDWEALAQDCEIGGWIAYLEFQSKGRPEWVCWSEAVHAMTDVIVQWVFGVRQYTRRAKLMEERIPIHGMNIADHAADRAGPEEIAIVRDLEARTRKEAAGRKNGPALELLLTEIILDGKPRIRRSAEAKMTETERVVRGRRLRTLQLIAREVLEQGGNVHEKDVFRNRAAFAA